MGKPKNIDENVNQIIDTAMERLKNILDANTIVGSIVVIDEQTKVLPISKISVGFVAGGGELNTKNKKSEQFPFAGGSGSGFTLEPIGFLVFNGNDIKYMSTQEFSPMSEVVKMSNNIINGVIRDKKVRDNEKNN